MANNDLVIFVKSFDGKAKETGREFHCYTLAQLKENEKGFLTGYVKDFYTDEALDVTGLSFGDIVDVDFVEPEFLGGKPKLCGIDKVFDSPYFGIVKK
jgi:hypothetical protein